MLANRTIQAASGNVGYQIQRSVRTRGAYPIAPKYFSRTQGVPTSTIKFTWSAWVKRGALGIGQFLLNSGAGSAASEDALWFSATDRLVFSTANASGVYIQTNAQFRDPSAWLHIVIIYDSAQASGIDRMKIYVNNVLQTFVAGATYLSPSQTTYLANNGSLLRMSSRTYAADEGFDGYWAEINFIDGQALTPSFFGQFDPTTGAWSAKRYAGTYGNNGFYLDFSDASSLAGVDQTPTMTSATAPSGIVTASAESSGGEAWKAFDKNAASYWYANSIVSWLAYEFTSTTVISKYGITTDGAGNEPTAWTFQGWNGSSYVVLDTRTGVTGLGTSPVYFTCNNATPYIKYRLNITAGTGNIALRELALFIDSGLTTDRSVNKNHWLPTNIALSGSTAISTFTSVGTTSWVAPAGVTSVQYLVVGGGGGGNWGGGGAGGFRTGTLSVTPGNSYTVTVGAGGAGGGSNGSNSVFSSITSIGGGAGPNSVGNGGVGGSGGGGGSSNGLGGAGTAGQGFAGGRGYSDLSTYTSGGGGGGSSQAGADGGGPGPGGKGGDGTASSISGSTVIYAGGGGGYGDTYGPGVGGTGSGSTPNRGGGGTVSAGGSGVVILSYPGTPTVPTYDSMLDSPLGSGGGERGNYCTLNPLSTSVATYVKEANLSLSGNSLGEYPGVGGHYLCLYREMVLGVYSGSWWNS